MEESQGYICMIMCGRVYNRYKTKCELRALYPTTLYFKYRDYRQSILNIEYEETLSNQNNGGY